MGKDDRSFGERLREARTQAHLSQSELEARSGIPKARLSRYENGHVVPSIQTLERLAVALGVSEAALLGEQRAFLEEFSNTLTARGVRLVSKEQGIGLANALADIVQAVVLTEQDTILLPETPETATAQAMASAGSWDSGDGASSVGVEAQ